jgi:hypothetical protein
VSRLRDWLREQSSARRTMTKPCSVKNGPHVIWFYSATPKGLRVVLFASSTANRARSTKARCKLFLPSRRFASDAVQLRGVNRQGKSCWSIGGGNKVVT